MDYLARLQAVEKTINENKILRAKLEQKKEQLEEEYKKLIADLEAENVKETDLVQTIKNLEIEINEEVTACEEKLK